MSETALPGPVVKTNLRNVRCFMIALWLAALVPSSIFAQVGLPYIEKPAENASGESESPSSDNTAPSDEDRSRDRRREPDVPATEIAPPASPRVASRPKNLGFSPQELRVLWSKRLVCLNDGNFAKADEVLTRIVEKMRDSGWPNAVAMGLSVADEARDELREGRRVRAKRLAQAACALAPGQTIPHLVTASIAWKNGEALTAVSSLVMGIRASWADPWQRSLRWANVSIGLSVSLLFASVLFALAGLYRYSRALRFGLIRMLPPGSSRVQAGILVFTALFTPVLLGTGVVWVLLLWCVSVAFFYGTSERIAACLIVAFLGLLPICLPVFLAPLSYAGSRADDAYRAATDIEAESAAARLSARANPSPQEFFILGLRALWGGDSDLAAEYLKTAADAGESSASLMISLGNVQFIRGDLAKAERAYRAALVAEPSNVMALFNLARLKYSQTSSAEAGELHRQASDVDYQRVEAWDEEQRRIGPTYVVRPGAPVSVLAGGAFQSDPSSSRRAAADAWFVLAGGIDKKTSAFSALICLLLIVLTGVFKPYRGRSVEDEHKAQPLDRIRHEIEVHRHQARINRLRRIVAMVFAGAGQLLGGRSLIGLVLCTTFAACLLVIVTTAEWIPSLVPNSAVPPSLVLLGASLGAAVCYGISVVHNFRDQG